MKRIHFNQKGFEAVALIVVVLVVAVIGFATYKFINLTDKEASTTQSASTVVPETLETSADLSAAGKALDSDGSELDALLNDSSLDADINALL
jgi:hypothetical protein